MRTSKGKRSIFIAVLVAFSIAIAAVAGLAVVTLTDPSSHTWDIDEQGTGAPPSSSGTGMIGNGSIDAYDTFGALCITASGATYTTQLASGDFYAGVSAPTTELSGRQYLLGLDTLRGLEVQRRVYVPSTGGTDSNSFVRYLDAITNTTGSDITVQVRFGTCVTGSNNNDLGSDSSTVAWGSSDGDTLLETADEWYGTDDSSSTSGDPSLAFIVQGVGASERVDYVSLNPYGAGDQSDFVWIFDAVTVPAGTTIAFLTFMIQDNNQTLARSEVTNLASLPLDATSGLTGTQLSWIRNFSFCDDCDGDGYNLLAGDCNDWDPLIHPGVTTDPCDGADNDCDTSTPDGSSESWYGTPCDGLDTDLCLDGIEICISSARGCGDDLSSILDRCDGLDNDCNPSTPDGSTDPAVGAPCDGTDTDLCPEGTGTCVSGAFVCTDTTGDTPDLCNGTDDDCDTSTHDGLDESWYATGCDGGDDDLCENGLYDCLSGTQTCVETLVDILDVCDGADNDCDPATPDGYGDDRVDAPCDGSDPDLCAEGVGRCVGGAFECTDTMDDTPELCDGIDNDCDGSTADGVDEDWLDQPCDGSDADLCDEGTYSCISGTQVCSDTTGDIDEACDGTDNDCDPATPDGEDEDWSEDPCDGPDTDLCAEGAYACEDGGRTCGDHSADNYEMCNGVDDDCNPTTLESADTDGDGISSCGGDCNDGDPAIHPGAVEACDGIDEDCNPTTDHDGDGDTVRDCEGDCAPMNPNVSPLEEEICGDGVDNDCDDLVDGLDPDCSEAPGGGGETGCGCTAAGLDGKAAPAWAVLVVLGMLLWRRGKRGDL